MSAELKRAAQYVRMSTEQQAYSISQQIAANAAYALANGIEIVRTYEDAGISGLTLSARNGLQQLLADVVMGQTDFSVILTYDVSRWGRFQDADQSAHYEFLCRQAGVNVEYCAEPFSNDGSMSSAIIKNLKRAMAAEYSRELSAKVAFAKQRAAAMGFWMGGPAGYGFRRQTVGPDGRPGVVLQWGEGKAIQSHRVILIHGPPDEVATVRRIYQLFLQGCLNPHEIAQKLNREHRPAEGGVKWTLGRVRCVLRNERYVGVYTLKKSRGTLVASAQRPDLRLPGTFKPMISSRTFEAARHRLCQRKPPVSDDALLAELKAVLRRNGRLSSVIISRDPKAHAASTYISRFGGLLNAYKRINYAPSAKQIMGAQAVSRDRPGDFVPGRTPLTINELLSPLRKLFVEEGYLSVGIINGTHGVSGSNEFRLRLGGMRRTYALVGFVPPEQTQRVLDRRGGQTINREQAARLAQVAERLWKRDPTGANFFIGLSVSAEGPLEPPKNARTGQRHSGPGSSPISP